MSVAILGASAQKLPAKLEAIVNAMQPVFPEIWQISGPATEPEVVANGRKVLQFCSPNYLGLSNHPAVRQGAINAINEYGAGVNGSAIISGRIDLYAELERELAIWHEQEATVVYNSVSLANAGTMVSILNPPLLKLVRDYLPDVSMTKAIFMDGDNHSSLFEAMKLVSVDKTYVYEHGDMTQLEAQLRRSTHELKLIVTDGYFSMSAQLAKLPEIVRLAERYGALVMVDDAHGTGVYGATGRGVAEHFGVEGSIDFSIGSLGKALGVRGGYVTASEALCRYLKINSKGYIFSGVEPPAVPGGVLAALAIARLDGWRREALMANAAYLRNGLLNLGYDILGEGPIVPWLIGDERQTIQIGHDLYEAGILAPPIRYPAVAKGQERIRFILMATHTREQIDRVIDACDKVGRKHGVPRNLIAEQLAS